MGQLWEYVKMALANIRMNRGRSFLTMLGIIIGVSSVILIMSVGNGARMEMEQELTAVAGGQIYIYVNSNLEEVPVITEADREAIRMLDGVKGCTSTAGNMLNSVTTGKGTFDAIVNYADPDDEFSNNSVMACGHWYTWDDFYAGNDVAVISEADAVRMFGTTDVIGLTFEMDDGDVIKNMRIVGVKKSIDGAFVATGYGDAYLDINVPYTSDSYWAQFNDFDNVYVFSQNSSGTKEIAQEVKGLLEARHGMLSV